MTYQRPQARLLLSCLAEPRRFVHVVAGPRQVGKSTLVQHLAGTVLHAEYVTLDDAMSLAAARSDPSGSDNGMFCRDTRAAKVGL